MTAAPPRKGFSPLNAAPALAAPTAFAPARGVALDSQITRLCDTIEPLFVAAGARLSDTADLLTSVRLPLAELSALHSGGTLQDLHSLVLAFHDELDALAADLAAVMEGITNLDSSARSLELHLGNIRNAIKTLGMVMLNARITVASLGSHRDRLAGFVEDATALVAETLALLSSMETAIAALQKLTARTHQQTRALLEQTRRDTQSAVATMTSAHAAFAAELGTLALSGDSIASVIQRLLTDTATAVSGLQIGDTTRQRLEHCRAILGWPALDPRLALGLSAAQLADTALAHAEDVATFATSSRALEQGLAELLQRHLLPFTAPPAAKARHTAPPTSPASGAAGLTLAIAAIAATTQNALLAQQALTEVSATLATALADLVTLVDGGTEVEARMTMIGLNAVIACAGLGREGFAMKEISGQLQDLAAEVASLLPLLRSELDAMGTVSDRTTRHLSTAATRATALTQDHARALSAQIDLCTSRLDTARHVVAEVGAKLARPNPALHEIEAHAVRLSDLCTTLSAPPDAARSGAPLPDPALAEAIAGLYTMGRERDVQTTFFGPAFAAASAATTPQPAACAPSATPDTSAQDLDDIFF